MAVDPKIIYLESDEEITSVVDKLRKTEFKKVVLVVPKEASLLQSVVNLKLLKRQAENLEKSISIVTQDKVGRNLAENIGIIASAKIDERVKEMEPVLAETAAETQKEERGPLADTKEILFKKESEDDRGHWDVADEVDSEDLVVKEEEPKQEDWEKTPVKEQKEENLMPKFPYKKASLIVGSLVLVLLLAGYILLPQAKATILVQAEKKEVSIDFKADANSKLDAGNAVIPAQVIEVTKDASKQYPATGKKNVGTRAAGSLRISNISGTDISWVAGTRFYPDGKSSLVYTATSAINVPDGGQAVTVGVQATEPGDQYNGYASQPFILVSNPGLLGVTIMSTKDGITGGTNKEVTYVTQGDINSAKDDLTKDAFSDAEGDFAKKVTDVKVIDNTKKETVVSTSSNPSVNGEASNFTLTVKVSVKALAYSLNDISSIVKSEVNKELGYSKQIIDDGSKNADVSVSDTDLSKGTFTGTVKADAFVSSKLDSEKIKGDLVGLNATKAENYLKGLDDVSQVKFDFWPSFIKIFPRLKNHIYLTIEVANPDGGN